MKYDAKKVLRNLKEKMIEEQIKIISADLDSSNSLTVAVALSELKRLKDRWHVQEAIKALSSTGDAAVISAIRYLSSIKYPLSFKEIDHLVKKSERIRKEIVTLSQYMTPEDGCKLLSLLLEDRSSAVKIQSLRQLEKVQCDESVEKAKKFLEDEDPKVKVESIKVLLNLGENVDEKIVTEIIENTKLPFEIRTMALKIFVMHFKDSLPLLKKMAESTYSKMNSVAISLMGKFPCDEVWESLETVILNDSFPSETIQSALKSASNTCRERKALEEMAIKYVNYPSKSLKITALRVLMGVESQHVEGIIEAFLEGKDRNLKLSVVPFVEEYSSKNNVEVLLESLEDDDEEMMEKSLKVLGRLKIKDERIRSSLFDHTIGVRIQALKALISSGDIDLEELMEFVRSASEPLEIKIEALNGIAKIAPQRLEELL